MGSGIPELAGFFAAHAVWSISTGEVLIPMLGIEAGDGARTLIRFEGDSLHEAVRTATEELEANTKGAAHAVLVFDAYATLPTGRTDALMLRARSHAHALRFSMVIPYRPAEAGFEVRRPEISELEGAHPGAAEISRRFFAGVDAHPQGAMFWSGARRSHGSTERSS